jgi:hypothetical protein
MPTIPAISNLTWRLAVVALLVEVVHLAWEQLHGGIQTHHFLRSAALPGFSNAWGVLLLPGLAAWTGGRIEKRLAAGTRPAGVVVVGLLALLAGLALSVSFAQGWETGSSVVFFGMLVIALLLPVCRAECWLGLVLGMGFTFGAVIPTFIGAVIALLSALVHLGLKPVALRAWAQARSSVSAITPKR